MNDKQDHSAISKSWLVNVQGMESQWSITIMLVKIDKTQQPCRLCREIWMRTGVLDSSYSLLLFPRTAFVFQK